MVAKKEDKMKRFQKRFGVSIFSLGALGLLFSVFGINNALKEFTPYPSDIIGADRAISISLEFFKFEFLANLFSTTLTVSVIFLLFGVLFYTEGRKK